MVTWPGTVIGFDERERPIVASDQNGRQFVCLSPNELKVGARILFVPATDGRGFCVLPHDPRAVA